MTISSLFYALKDLEFIRDIIEEGGHGLHDLVHARLRASLQQRPYSGSGDGAADEDGFKYCAKR